MTLANAGQPRVASAYSDLISAYLLDVAGFFATF